MATILTVRSPQPWRLMVALDEVPSTAASAYAITRVDGVATPVAPALVWLAGENTAEVALSEPLLDGVLYKVAVAGIGSARVSSRAPAVPPLADPAEQAPITERLGLDLAWCSSGSLDARRQVPRRTGVECVRHDLAALCLLRPSEVFHRPRAGVGLDDFTNAPDTERKRAVANVRSAWTKDPRVATGSVSVTETMEHETGELVMAGQVLVRASGERVDVSTADLGA